MSGGETGLADMVNTTISVITSDGRQIVGLLKGYDQATNLILDECHERVYSTKAGVEKLALGLYVIRGDNIAVVGEVDDEMDSSIDFAHDVPVQTFRKQLSAPKLTCNVPPNST